MRILVCGSRDFTKKYFLRNVLYDYIDNDDLVIIEGGARGADQLAREWAHDNSVEVETYEAEWETYGKRAGFLRNKEMLEHGKPDLVLAFYTDSDNPSKGTKMMTDLARKAGVETKEC
jgi:hypothetical protein